jgi:hypothetical protein
MSKHTWTAARGAGFAVLFLLGGFPLLAANLESQASKTDVVVLISPAQKQDEVFRQLVADAAQYKLQKLGLRTHLVAATPEETQQPLAKERDATAALVCRFSVEGQQMDVRLGWYDATTGASPAVVEITGEVDLNLDGVILAALDQMIAKVHDRIQAMADRNASDVVQVAPASLTTGEPKITTVTPARPASPTRRVLVSGGFAPFLPEGAAAYYFTLGYLPSLLASIFIDTPMGPLGLGLYLGMDYFTATGSQDYANTYLLPFGVDIRYELGSAFLRPFFHVAGGPALFVMVTGTQGTITSVVPFLKSGIGLDLMMTGSLGINVLADYDIYFEMPYLVMGFSPSVNMELRL